MSMKPLLARSAVLLALVLVAQPGTAFRAVPEVGPFGTVILLHGFGRTVRAMTYLERGLAERGFAVRNVGYPWREASFEQIAAHLATEIERCCAASEAPVHFVTHSMGGIVVRAFLDTNRPENLGRVVMIAPPNGGSEWVDALRGNPIFELAGPAAQELGTDPESVPQRLGPVDFELGVLAGNRSWNPLGSWLIPGDDDGAVAVDSARIEGMKDFRVVDESHTRIRRSPEVVSETLHFLEHGSFTEVSDRP